MRPNVRVERAGRSVGRRAAGVIIFPRACGALASDAVTDRSNA